MKKLIFLAVASILFSTISWGQGELKIIQPNSTKILNGDTLIIYGAGDITDEMNVNLDIINSGSINDNSVYVRRDSLSLPMRCSSDNEFCWISCYDTAVNVSPNSQAIPAKDTAGGVNGGASLFQGHYWPYGHAATAYIRYAFYNQGNPPSDSSWVVVEYNPLLTGIQNISSKDIAFSAPYPNPANTTLCFNYSLNSNTQAANLKIFNLLGECVQIRPLDVSKGNTIINVQAMSSGVYVCEIEASGCQPAYQKMVISH